MNDKPIEWVADAAAYPADAVAELYFRRWRAERVFQRVTEVFGLGG